MKIAVSKPSFCPAPKFMFCFVFCFFFSSVLASLQDVANHT